MLKFGSKGIEKTKAGSKRPGGAGKLRTLHKFDFATFLNAGVHAMAGRSGAAAIEIALREAATSFDVRTTAQRLRARGDIHLADALELAAKPSPTVDRREGECLLVFSLGAGASTPCKMDLSDICSVAVGCSVEIAYCSEPEWRVLTVGFFLE